MFFLIFSTLVILDQASKYYFELFFQTERIHILGDYLSLAFVKNSGIAFSLPLEGLLLKIITLILTIGIAIYFFRYEKLRNSRLVQIAYALVLSGAVSNGVDRIAFGSVTDFIAVKYFAIFNFADIFISIGAFLLFLAHFQHERSNKQ